MRFLESSDPSKFSIFLRNKIRIKLNIDIKEPLSSLSSLFSFLVMIPALLFFQDKINDVSLLLLLFAHMSNQIGSTMMHGCFDQCMRTSDETTMHTGLMIRVFTLSLNYFVHTRIISYIILAFMCNIVFVTVEFGLASFAGAVYLLQVLTTPEKYIALRYNMCALLFAFFCQLLSRETNNIRIRKLNTYVEPHTIWHLTMTYVFLSYVYLCQSTSFDREGGTTFDICFYIFVFVFSFANGLYKYGKKCDMCFCGGKNKVWKKLE